MPGPVYLLDTSVVLHLLRGNDLGEYLAQTFGLLDAVNRPLVSVVTHGELRVIADENGWGGKKLEALANALDNLVTIDVNDETVLQNYVAVCRACKRHPKGSRTLSNNDAWIAACAKSAYAVLLTTDRDFMPLHPEHCSVQFVESSLYLNRPGG